MNICGDDSCTDPDCPGTGRHPIALAPAPTDQLLCDDLAQGFCGASIDGFCVGGWLDGHDVRRCHG